MGNFGPVVVCYKMATSLFFVDPETLMGGEIPMDQYFKKDGIKPLFTGKPIRYIVLETTPFEIKNGGYQKATVSICKESEIGQDIPPQYVNTHLGAILNEADVVLGFDIKNSNVSDENLDSYKKGIPDVILTRKSYDRPPKRFWTLKKWKIERDDDYEQFLEDLEEDKEMRGKINLYKDNSVKMDIEEYMEKVKDVPHVSLDELFENLKI